MRVSEQQQLLADVLAEGATARDHFLDETLRIVRRRRRVRQFGQSAALTAVLVAAILTLWPQRKPVPMPVATDRLVLRVVTTKPMKASAIVSTGLRSVEWVMTESASVTMISTPSFRIEELTDEQLLARLGDEPVILVRHATNEAELIRP